MLIEILRNYRILLASKSLRRQQLLRDMGIDFEIVFKDFDESYPEGLTGAEIAGYVAEKKAMVFAGKLSDNEIVITADTIVWCGGRVLGKPVDANDAINMLHEISGKVHEVITGVSLLSSGINVTFTESTRVTFVEMSDAEIRYYVDKYAPYDKAGAYGIQEWIGLTACSHIDGSYFNVVGLPVQRLYEELKKIIIGDRHQYLKHNNITT
ncbi:MAG: septum formation protein Maf [Bacteroidetes bacterium GWA2_40_15]|nr:MAG: septum formation protein Maf [Bacteroidetes bacterium GWA2_40_15]OFX86122.1 MAG: septum formation protein Maf [Bacteroidetes bacterium GWC2_40_22]HBQ82273.1 septum formation protein Maf [Bacteroidales bacterium]